MATKGCQLEGCVVDGCLCGLKGGGLEIRVKQKKCGNGQESKTLFLCCMSLCGERETVPVRFHFDGSLYDDSTYTHTNNIQ